jgi:hypothetical protein
MHKKINSRDLSSAKKPLRPYLVPQSLLVNQGSIITPLPIGLYRDIPRDVPSIADSRIPPPAHPGHPLLTVKILMKKEAALQPIPVDNSLQYLCAYSRPLCMRLFVSSPALSHPPRDTAVVVEPIHAQATHQSAGTFGKLHRLPYVIGHIFPQLPVHIGNRK